MSNPNNVFNIVGRATATPMKLTPNADGSYGEGLTVYADNSFKSKKTGGYVRAFADCIVTSK